MLKSTDILATGGTPEGIRFAFTDVSESARTLARSHLAGPAAAASLAEGLIAVSILSADIAQPEEAVSIYMKTDAPIQSLLVEATFEGTLRGYTGKKILPDFDEQPEPNLDAIFAGRSTIQVTNSIPGHLLGQSGIQAPNLRPTAAVESYYRLGAQRIVAISSCVLPGNDGPDLARGFLVELMPDGNQALFERVVSELKSTPFSNALEAASGASSLCSELGLEKIRIDPPRPLRFACRCSHESALSTLRTLSKDELLSIATANRNVDIFCHMCGKCHTITPAEIQNL